MNRPTKSNHHAWRDYPVLLSLGAVLLAMLLSAWLPLTYPYSNDTAGYIDEARHVLLGQGFLRGTDWQDTAHDLAPFPLFPPGYPLAIAAFSLTGLDFKTAALAVSWLAWLLLLPAIRYALRPLLGRWPALAIAALAVSSPGLIEWGYLALSDSSMLLLSVAALGVLIRHPVTEEGGWRWLLLSGALAGMAYWLRNAAAVLPLTLAAFYVAATLLRLFTWHRALLALCVWGCAFAIFVVPLFVRNFLTFGDIQPYLGAHGGTDFGIVKALRLSLWSQWLDIAAWRGVADLAWDAAAALLILPPVVALLVWLGWRRWRGASVDERLRVLLLALYAGIGFAMIVWGRSRFDWVEVTLTRQLMPYSWALLALIVWALLAHRGLLIGLFCVLLAGRGLLLAAGMQQEKHIQRVVAASGDFVSAARQLPSVVLTSRIKMSLAQDVSLKTYLVGLPTDAHILSNFGSVLSLESDRHVRGFEPTPANLAALTPLVAALQGRPLIAVFYPTNAWLRQPDAAHWQTRLLGQLSLPYTIELATSDLLVLRFP